MNDNIEKNLNNVVNINRFFLFWGNIVYKKNIYVVIRVHITLLGGKKEKVAI